MGLDLVVEGCARPGYEAEWRRILERAFGDEEPLKEDVARFTEISIPPYERLGAPRVGYDDAADAWIIKATDAGAPDEIARVLEEHHGYYVLRLIESDGLPEYSHGGLYEGADETSFRGAFLSECNDVLSTELIEEAWVHKFPEEAVRYGQALLGAARAARTGGAAPKQPDAKGGLLSRFRRKKQASSAPPFEEQLQVVEAAGRWFVFWGDRGHAIRAWF